MVAERSQRQCSYSTYCRKLCVECDVSLSSSEATIGGCTGQQLRPAAYAAVEFDGDDCIRAAASTRSFFLFFFFYHADARAEKRSSASNCVVANDANEKEYVKQQSA